MAQEEYESYEGLHGLPDYDDCYQTALDIVCNTDSEDDEREIETLTDALYSDAMEEWIDYYVESAIGPDDKDDKWLYCFP